MKDKMPMTRQIVLDVLVGKLLNTQKDHPLRIAIDGIDASGKTYLADELAELLRGNGNLVLRASADDFQRPRAERYRRGRYSAEGYYLDAFDYPAILQHLLIPLGPGGDRRCCLAIFDYIKDQPLPTENQIVPQQSILLFDGVFLLRPELINEWDYKIFIQVDFDTSLRRALERDLSLFDSAEEVNYLYQQRYLPAQKIYLESACPQALANIVIDNTNPDDPVILPSASIRS